MQSSGCPGFAFFDPRPFPHRFTGEIMVSPASAAKPSTPPQGSASARYIRGLRALTRSSELALVAAAALVGLVAALCVTAMTQTAIFMHKLIFDLPFDVRLSAADRVSIIRWFCCYNSVTICHKPGIRQRQNNVSMAQPGHPAPPHFPAVVRVRNMFSSGPAAPLCRRSSSRVPTAIKRPP